LRSSCGQCEQVGNLWPCRGWQLEGAGKRGDFVLIFICGVVGGGEEAAICHDEGMVIEEI